MRHRKAGSKFNRNSSHKKAMFRNMVTSLLKYERIKTTDQKAKELRGWADHIITLAKRGDLHARRQAMAIVREKQVVYKVFEEAPKRFASVSGGYTRVIKLGRRPGDAAMMSIIELVTPEVSKPKKKKASGKKAAAKPAPAKKAVEEKKSKEDSTEIEKKAEKTPEPVEVKTEEADEAQPDADGKADKKADGDADDVASVHQEATPEDTDK
jgi:large subunit ribosomal protein L17